MANFPCFLLSLTRVQASQLEYDYVTAIIDQANITTDNKSSPMEWARCWSCPVQDLRKTIAPAYHWSRLLHGAVFVLFANSSLLHSSLPSNKHGVSTELVVL